MIINKEEVEKAADEYGYDVYGGTGEGNFRYVADNAFMAGVNFIEEKVQQYIGNIIIENQGLKLYKDNEAERFKELAVEFGEFIIDYEKTPHLNRLETTEELYELFLKQRNEKN